jgi:hypothetical protein
LASPTTYPSSDGEAPAPLPTVRTRWADCGWQLTQTGLSADIPKQKNIPCGFGRAFLGKCKAAFKSYTADAAHFPERFERDTTRTKWVPRCPCIVGKITILKTTISPTYCLFAKEGFECELQQPEGHRMEALKADTKIHELLEHGVPCEICGRLFAGP